MVSRSAIPAREGEAEMTKIIKVDRYFVAQRAAATTVM